ncbi:ClpXP protease specificity-enhancing factor SspB [Sneathiella marina]|uniref:ClpXP protease specificity-enhancing factor SspB n=1 Tax=Sneathiella marina TaxID=2950108 RepID=A0ABY4W0W6_9PROT|nr:ClpXP protease specificity-enhancing factor SspB [Sneathiella marina]USG60607.1 ClpXP protease specificity-enhancing factor SspB [Sneathiella marina]
MADDINYNSMVEKALLEVVRNSLRHAAEYGLPNEQHFYITFKTRFPGVTIPKHLSKRYQDEMTIVLQHQFWDIKVETTYFSVDLSFNHNRETLTVPFDALTAFADPSVQFGLQFTSDLPGSSEGSISTDDDNSETSDEESVDSNTKPIGKQGEVIALDAFRKK